MPPDTTITLGALALTVNYISMFEFAAMDDQTAPIDLEFECSLDGAVRVVRHPASGRSSHGRCTHARSAAVIWLATSIRRR
jgi:hypothetical protein